MKWFRKHKHNNITNCPECGGELSVIDEDYWECEDCGKQFYIDNDGDLVSEIYEEEMNELDD